LKVNSNCLNCNSRRHRRTSIKVLIKRTSFNWSDIVMHLSGGSCMGTRCNLVGDVRSTTERVKHPLACERDKYNARTHRKGMKIIVLLSDPCVCWALTRSSIHVSNPDALCYCLDSTVEGRLTNVKYGQKYVVIIKCFILDDLQKLSHEILSSPSLRCRFVPSLKGRIRHCATINNFVPYSHSQSPDTYKQNFVRTKPGQFCRNTISKCFKQ
jgi:hypothetical protein